MDAHIYDWYFVIGPWTLAAIVLIVPLVVMLLVKALIAH